MDCTCKLLLAIRPTLICPNLTIFIQKMYTALGFYSFSLALILIQHRPIMVDTGDKTVAKGSPKIP